MARSTTNQPPKGQEKTPTPGVWTISITASLISSVLFVVFLQPLLTTLTTFISDSTSAVLGGWLDGAYSEAVVVSTDAILFRTQTLIMAVSLAPVVAALLAFLISDKIAKLPINTGESKGTFSIRKPLKYFMVAGAFMMILGGTGMLVESYVSIQANATFQRRLMVLTPALSPNERDNLLALWGRMQSRDDYEQIMHSMDSIAKQRKVVLPRRSI